MDGVTPTVCFLAFPCAGGAECCPHLDAPRVQLCTQELCWASIGSKHLGLELELRSAARHEGKLLQKLTFTWEHWARKETIPPTANALTSFLSANLLINKLRWAGHSFWKRKTNGVRWLQSCLSYSVTSTTQHQQSSTGQRGSLL